MDMRWVLAWRSPRAAISVLPAETQCLVCLKYVYLDAYPVHVLVSEKQS